MITVRGGRPCTTATLDIDVTLTESYKREVLSCYQ